MSRSVKLDTETLRAQQARAQEADRISHKPASSASECGCVGCRECVGTFDRISRDLAFAGQSAGYTEWAEELESI